MYEYNGTVTNVVDGDTVDVTIGLGFKIKFDLRVRLIGINTPEIHGVKKDSEEYKLGMKAKHFLENQVMGKKVEIRTIRDKQGKFGRYLAIIIADEVDIGTDKLHNNINISDLLVSLGYAKRLDY